MTDSTATRRADIETSHADAATAEVVADALRPDNTDSMVTETDGATVRTTIERETTGGLGSSVDDYVVNVGVAERIATTADSTHDT
jgi:hypothetical protein